MTAPAPAIVAPRSLSRPKTFFDRIPPMFAGGTINAAQLVGIQCKLDAFAASGCPIAYVAYGLATSFWETVQTMRPMPEIGRGAPRPMAYPASMTVRSPTAAATCS